MDNIDYRKLKKDLINFVGCSGTLSAVVEVDKATEEKLIKLAERYGVDLEEYVVK